jgi:probable FeS assembly SUF system protein SufT
MTDPIILTRDCDAIIIPAGDKVTLKAGEPVTLTQDLGGAFTVIIHGNMVRIDAKDADALGRTPTTTTTSSPAADTGPLEEETIYAQLRTCYDPEIPVNIVDLGLIYDLQIGQLPDGGYRVEVKMTLTAPGCGMGPVLQQDVETKVLALPNVKEAAVHLVWDPPWNRDMLSDAAKLELGLM